MEVRSKLFYTTNNEDRTFTLDKIKLGICMEELKL